MWARANAIARHSLTGMSQLLFRNEFSGDLAKACGKHFVRYTGVSCKKIYPTLKVNIQHFLSTKIIKYIQYNTLMSVTLVIIHF